MPGQTLSTQGAVPPPLRWALSEVAAHAGRPASPHLGPWNQTGCSRCLSPWQPLTAWSLRLEFIIIMSLRLRETTLPAPSHLFFPRSQDGAGLEGGPPPPGLPGPWPGCWRGRWRCPARPGTRSLLSLGRKWTQVLLSCPCPLGLEGSARWAHRAASVEPQLPLLPSWPSQGAGASVGNGSAQGDPSMGRRASRDYSPASCRRCGLGSDPSPQGWTRVTRPRL